MITHICLIVVQDYKTVFLRVISNKGNFYDNHTPLSDIYSWTTHSNI